MFVNLINNNLISTVSLPEKISGKYWIKSLISECLLVDIVGIESQNTSWVIKSNQHIEFPKQTNDVKNDMIILEPMSFYEIILRLDNKRAFIYTESMTRDRQIYKVFDINDETIITIGRDVENDICFYNEFVSSRHAKLTYINKIWEIEDLGSSNGTFVNQAKIKTSKLIVGSLIYIMGLKIVIGRGFISINNPDNKVKFSNNIFYEKKRQKYKEFCEEEYLKEFNLEYFYVSPRFKKDIEIVEYHIDSPPNVDVGNEMPTMLLMGPALTMSMASITTASVSINSAIQNGDVSRAIPSIVMASSMLLGSLMWPNLSRKFEKSRKRKKEAIRQKKYKEYLDELAFNFKKECSKQELILHDNFIHIDFCLNRINNIERSLWDRNINQNDFLNLRLGLGNTKLDCKINSPERHFSVEDDNLIEEVLVLCETPKTLKDIPISISFYEKHITGIIGDKYISKKMLQGIIFQILSFYSYHDLKMVFLLGDDDIEEFNFVKWLPHVWNNDMSCRFISTNLNELKEISAYLEKEIDAREVLDNNIVHNPHYVIFVLDRKQGLKAEMLKRIYKDTKKLGISVISVSKELYELPKECISVIEVNNEKSKLFDRTDLTGKTTFFIPDIFINEDLNILGKKLANIKLIDSESSFSLPKMLTFLEMFGVGKVEHLNCLSRWNENDPTKSLAVEIGVDTLGDSFKLDLHEKFHGPHGLVAGMTGSGKSELIITFILSLAVNFHPHELALILIDYKGGGMAKSFEKLPHTAGIITNLDGAAIKRSLTSIESELKRRQAIFSSVSKKINVSNIDIYKYQKLYRDGVIDEPLQHLFIISDEFAELKTQQPEFMAKLVSAARIGRSLGVHLILATQKPSGVVDDQIWSNSKFRVCLKVQDRGDSMDMLKRDDAAELTDTGRFYLQVGYNELFEMGQSAWAGAPYYPSDNVVVEKDNSVLIVDRVGNVIKQGKPKSNFFEEKNPKKQLDAITEYISNIAKDEKIKVKQLWLEPIKKIIFMEELIKKYSYSNNEKFILRPIIGEYDDPVSQSQYLYILPLSEDGNIVVNGIAGSGKATFIIAMIYSLITQHTPEQVNLYLLDFGAETLNIFSNSPHVGEIIFSHEGEKIINLIKYLINELENRKKIFRDFGGDYISYINNSNISKPSIVTVINNFTVFNEMYENLEEYILKLTREGSKYGLYFVISAIGVNGIRYRLSQNFKQIIVLQQNNDSDITSLIGKTNGLIPSKYKGRGLFKNEDVFEFQTAQLTHDKVPFTFLKKLCKDLKSNWKGTKAHRIKILPDKINIDFITEYIIDYKSLIIPIGIEKNTLEVNYFSFEFNFLNLVLSQNDEYSNFFYSLYELMEKMYKFDISMIDPNNVFTKLVNKENYYSGTKECENKVSDIFNIVLDRNNTYKEALQNETILEPFTTKIIFINSLVALKNVLSKENEEKLSLFLEKSDTKYKIFFIIADNSKNISSFSYSNWYKKNVTQLDGIWVGNGIVDQYTLKYSRITPELRENITDDFGFSFVRGNLVKVKLLSTLLN